MDKPREINPECIDDDEFWNCEALKLAVINPDVFHRYTREPSYTISGRGGLANLEFLTATLDMPRSDDFDYARVANFGQPLINACTRMARQGKLTHEPENIE